MAHFTTINGAYPSLQQIDKTCSVAPTRMESVVKIERGSLIYVDANGNFDLASTTQATSKIAAPVYIALQDQDNYPAGMAGSVGTGPSNAIAGFDDQGRAKELVAITQSRITGLSTTMPLTIQTDCFDSSITENTAVGTALTCGANGKFVAHKTGENIVGYLDKAPFSRWVNDAAIAGVRRTGAQLNVINVRLAWTPGVVTGA